MNREEIIKLSREADLVTWGFQSLEWEPVPNMEAIERFAALVAAQEREACAQVCVDAIAYIRGFGTEDAKQTGINVCNNLAKAIRGRGEK